MIIALAGRRVDPPDAIEVRFPASAKNIEIVRQRIRNKLQTKRATVLVSSAACGSDLLALSEAGNLGLRRRVVLPFDRDKFRTTSVTDRPGDWGGLYEKILDEVEMRQDLLIIKAKSETEAYTQVNHVIVDNAISLGLALQQPVAAMVVWDGKSRGAEDYTEEFGIYARSRGIPVDGVMSL